MASESKSNGISLESKTETETEALLEEIKQLKQQVLDNKHSPLSTIS